MIGGVKEESVRPFEDCSGEGNRGAPSPEGNVL